MADLKSKAQLSVEAQTLATSYSMVRYANSLYIPEDYETGDRTVTPTKDRCIWTPLTREDIQRIAFDQMNTMFSEDRQLASFYFMISQAAARHDDVATSLLIRTSTGLKKLGSDGVLHDPTGEFTPNTLIPVLNSDEEDKKFVWEQIVEWLGDEEEEAQALLRHLATALAPHWSAVKYMLLLGDGRNGKSLLMTMLSRIFGDDNTSNVTRQEMSEGSLLLAQLNGKLLNIVFDGQAVYLKDSGREKTIIAGEPISVRLLYSSSPTAVQTNALFIEGLNREPKTTDKSSALQMRIVRFWFPNVYPEDRAFWSKMVSDRYVGALLALLVDNYVREEDAAVMLAQTSGALMLRLEHMLTNSQPLQFVKYMQETDPSGANVLIGEQFTEVIKMFNSWRLKEMNDVSGWSEPDLLAQFRPVLHTERRSIRVNGQPRKVRMVTEFTLETCQLLEMLTTKEEEETDVMVDK